MIILLGIANDSVSVFIQDNFEHAVENFTTQLTLCYFVLKIVRTYSEKIFEQFIQTVKVQNCFLSQNAFLTCSWRFLKSNNLEQF